MTACTRCGEPTKKQRLYCSRVCYAAEHQRKFSDLQCEHCASSFTRRTLAREQARFCSVSCAQAARRGPARACKRCGKSPIASNARKYCSQACAILDSAVDRNVPCEHCKNPFKRDRNRERFCSNACSNASRILPRPACPQCGQPTKTRDRKFCSLACKTVALRKHPLVQVRPVKLREPRPNNLCELCSAPIVRKAKRCVSCKNIGKLKERKCIVCGGATQKGGRRTCSPECYAKVLRTPRNAAYTPEIQDKIRELRASGLTTNSIAASVGLTPGQISGLLERLNIPTPAALVRPPRVKKVKPKKPQTPSRGRPHQTYWLSRPAKQQPKPTTTEIDLTGLCRLAMVLREEHGVRVKDRVSFEEVTRAWRRIDPTHPGFRFKQPGNRGTVAEWRSK